MRCCECKFDFPDELLCQFRTLGEQGSLQLEKICGICALRLKNEFHGTNFKNFQGEVAEEMRLGAIKHLKRFHQTPREGGE